MSSLYYVTYGASRLEIRKRGGTMKGEAVQQTSVTYTNNNRCNQLMAEFPVEISYFSFGGIACPDAKCGGPTDMSM